MRKFAGLLLALLAVSPVRADTIRVVATGNFNNAQGDGGLLPLPVLFGPWNLEVTFTDGVPDAVPANPAVGFYPGVIQSFRLDAGGTVFEIWPRTHVQILNNIDSYLWMASTREAQPDPAAADPSYDEIILVLVAAGNGLPSPPFGSDALQAPPFPYPWNSATASYIVRGPAGEQLATATATMTLTEVQVTAVPLPATGGLLLAAVGGLAARRLRRT